jgi:hypothetical protein
VHDPAGQQIASLDVLLRAVDVTTVAVDAAGSTEATHAALDAVTAAGTPGLILVAAPHPQDQADVDRWAAGHAAWLTLTRPPRGHAVLTPLSTLLAFPDLPGVWSAGPDATPATPAVAAPRPVPEGDAEARARATTATAWELRAQLSRQIAETDAQRLVADRLRARLISEREWAASEADRVRASSSWRLGHRLVRLARLLTFRRDKGTDGLSRLAERMRAPVDE